MPTETDRLLTESQAAEYLQVSEVSLRRWRWLQTPDRPRWCRIGRSIRYSLQELERYVENHSEGPGSCCNGGCRHE